MDKFHELLKKYELPIDIFEITERPYAHGRFMQIKTPIDIILKVGIGGYFEFDYVHGTRIGRRLVNLEKLISYIAKIHKINSELKQTREECAMLRNRALALDAELTELKYQPGGPGYIAAQEHFENLAKK